MSRGRWRITVVVAAMLLATVPVVWGQATTGRISGIVKDTSGGVLPGVTVTVTEGRTGFTQTEVTGAQGNYTFVNLPLGEYTVTAELQGFKKASKSGFVLVADGRIAADFNLEVGTFTETVQVTVAAETVNTISGEVARTVDRAQVQDLALNGRNYMQLATLIPGAPMLDNNALDIMTGLGINTVINGGRNNTSLLTVDGGFNMDAGSNNSQISNVGVDFIDQVSIKTSNFSAEYGRNSGAAINVVTRTGSNTLKGSVYEYMRRDGWDTNAWFSQKKGTPKAALTYDNPGFSLGGPIAKDKIFFFGGVEWKRIRRFTGPTSRSLPTSAMRAGDFSAITTKIKDPVTGQNFPGNVIPADRITADGRAIANVYAAMSKVAATYDDTKYVNNAVFQDANPFDFRQDMIRLDYQPSGAHRFTTRVVLDHYNLIDPLGTFFGNSQMPTTPTNRKRPGRNVQLNHYWTLRNNLVNEAKFNYSGNGQTIPPTGEAWKRAAYGFQFPQLYSGGGRYEDSIPDVTITNFASFAGAAQSLISPTWDYSFSDNVTWIKGAHTVKAGVLTLYNEKDQNGRSNYAGQLAFSTSGNTKSTGYAFADALLGNFRTYQEAQIDPMGYFRYWQFEGFVTDAWRLNDRLSVEAGVRYAWQMPTITLGNNTASFDMSRYNQATAVTLFTNGTIDTSKGGDRYNGLTRPGEVPSSQLSNVPNANAPAVLALPIAASRGYYKNQNLWAPRFSFAWKPSGSDSTAVRGGVGLFYDRPEGNLYFGLANNPPFSLSSEYQNGNLSNPAGGTAAAVAPWATILSLDPNLKIPRVWNWSLGVQRELGFFGLFGEITYVGNKGQHLLRRPDINQVPFSALEANLVTKYATNYLRPYKGFTTINYTLSDGRSDYDALQVFLSRRRGSVNFTLNYTLGRSYDTNASSTGDNIDSAQDWRDTSASWGPSGNSRKHIFVATWTYRLPFWANRRDIAGSLLGGWEVSGITRFQSGSPFDVTGTTSIGGRRADYAGGDIKASNAGTYDPTSTSVAWLDTAKFAIAPEGRPGNITRNQFVGPSYQVWDISVRKQFRVKGSVKAQFQADFFNAFNKLNLNNPNTNISNATFGTITGAGPMRNVQLGFRLTF